MTNPNTKLENLQQRVRRLKKELNAVIVAHNYQRPEVQDVADFNGDSLELARRCAEIEAEIIVFCGVRFMAEIAFVLSPSSTVLLSHPTAGCTLADMIAVNDLREWKMKYPKAAVVSYVNTTADIKAESDICCTSANGVKIVEAVPNNEILFIPDQNLGHYISTKTSKKMILYPGFCVTHARLNAKQVKQAKQKYPEAKVLVHPECHAEVIALADATVSTSQMIRYAKESSAEVFLIGTEEGILHPLRKANPGKTFHLIANSLVCPDMKKTRLETIIETMELKQNIVTVHEEIKIKAKQAIDRMLAVT